MKLNTIYNGNTLEVLKTLPDESIDCVVTSPPYWALRDYGIDRQLGLEPTFQEYLEKLWVIFDEVYRVLKPTGTIWVNLGDTYMNNSSYSSKGRQGYNKKEGMIYKKSNSVKQKSLCLIPHRFAIGMIERGWILRNDIIWHKPNCMPSSVKDRFTVDYEHIFFFVKQRKYYFEQQRENTGTHYIRKITNRDKKVFGGDGYTGNQKANREGRVIETFGRNRRSVWSINTKPFKDAHFAVFPPEIPETCIKSGCPEKGIVLDPFMGSGTTAVVAKKLGRNYVGIELNPEYVDMANRRLKKILI